MVSAWLPLHESGTTLERPARYWVAASALPQVRSM
jgi:hypothetical protein